MANHINEFGLVDLADERKLTWPDGFGDAVWAQREPVALFAAVELLDYDEESDTLVPVKSATPYGRPVYGI